MTAELFPHQQKAIDALRQNPIRGIEFPVHMGKTILDTQQSESRFYRQGISPVIRYIDIDMANVKKGQTVPAPQWWKHLKKFNKRLFWKQQRKADHKMTKDQNNGRS